MLSRWSLRRGPAGLRTRLALLVALALAVPALLVLTVGGGDRAGAGRPPEGVRNGSALQDLSGWSAASAAGPTWLSRVPGQGAPGGVPTVVDVRRDGGEGAWAWVQAALQDPARFVQAGQTYRLRLWVRDVDASGAGVELLLANGNYLGRPSQDSAYDRWADDGWHELVSTFVATSGAAPDTALYLALPASGPVHLQLTGASLQRAPVSAAGRQPSPAPAGPGRPPDDVLSFAGPAGAAPDRRVWTHDLGGGGWGNDELETYTADTSNAHLDGDGHLVISARREDRRGPDRVLRHYTSARLTTKGAFEVPPGSYVEAALWLPVGPGVWPAFWTMGTQVDRVGWPAAGELDVVEVYGGHPTVAESAVHLPAAADPTRDEAYSGGEAGGATDLGHDLDSQWHTYGVYFDGTVVRFYVDRTERMVVRADEARRSGRDWPFDRPQFLLLDVAVGGHEDPAATVFPRSMTVGPISVWHGGTPF